MKWWNDEIDIVEIDGSFYGLDGWNGEIYTECFECEDLVGDRFWKATGKYRIKEILKNELNEENEIVESHVVGYEVL